MQHVQPMQQCNQLHCVVIQLNTGSEHRQDALCNLPLPVDCAGLITETEVCHSLFSFELQCLV